MMIVVYLVLTFKDFVFVYALLVLLCIPEMTFCFVPYREQQGTGAGPNVEKRWDAGCLMFPGGCPESETSH